jgi:hypothetical protein
MDLQLYTSHILAAHAALDEKNYTLQDVKEQRNRYENKTKTKTIFPLTFDARVDSERARLIAALAQVPPFLVLFLLSSYMHLTR